MNEQQTLYHVHIYRVMRLYFPGIEAESHEKAAQIASEKPTDEAQEIDDCEGESYSAMVDVAGDTEYAHSRFVDFEPERLRMASKGLLAALREVKMALEHHRHWLPSMPAHLVGVIDTAVATATQAKEK
jgi:hypothetical protein